MQTIRPRIRSVVTREMEDENRPEGDEGEEGEDEEEREDDVAGRRAGGGCWVGGEDLRRGNVWGVW